MAEAAGKTPDHIVAATPAADNFAHTTSAMAEVLNMSRSEVGRIHTAANARSAVGTYAFIPHLEIGDKEATEA
jgi:hypothetical protein